MPRYLALALAAAAVTLAAQEPPPIRTEVNYVRVDLYPMAGDAPVPDLRREEVELLEDNVPQQIDRFERVHIDGPRPQTLRREPSSLDEMRRALRDPRARMFVIFLDPRHVDLEGSMKARQPLINALNSLVGGDDLIAVMTPEMSPRELTFTRRTNTIEALLSTHWGTREWLGTRDRTELEYENCYNVPYADGIAAEMIQRHREVRVLEALDGLIDHVSTLRDERKAIITVSDGWPLYGPSRTLARPLADPRSGAQTQIPVPKVGFDPGTGRPSGRDRSTTVVSSDGTGTLDRQKCEVDRLGLAELRNEERFVRAMQRANRVNVSFYPVGPGGFSASYRPLTPQIRSLQMMADITDGLAITQPHAMESGIRRIVDDLSSYYLLGYYSNVKPDGRYHRLSVRVKRPGVSVRARAGYFAAVPAAGSGIVVPPSSVDTSEAQVITKALASLAQFSRTLPIRSRVAAAWTPTGATVIRAVVEVPGGTASGDDWSKGGQAEASILSSSGQVVASGRAAIDPALLVASIDISPASPLPPDDYRLQVRVKGASALGSTDVVPFTLDAAPLGTGVMFYRRYGLRDVRTADVRFRRTERLVIEMPALLADDISARVLGRTGSPLTVPVAASIRGDADGTRWRRVEVTLAPLAPADYVVETSSGTERTMTAFRLIP